jgi:hypothetical protein
MCAKLKPGKFASARKFRADLILGTSAVISEVQLF